MHLTNAYMTQIIIYHNKIEDAKSETSVVAELELRFTKRIGWRT